MVKKNLDVSLSILFSLFCCSHSHSVMGPAFASTRNRAASHDHKWSQDLTPRVDAVAGCLTSYEVGSRAVFDHVYF